MAEDRLERSLEDLREMESVLIDIDPEKEAMVPRPDPDEAELAECADLLDRAEDELFETYRDLGAGRIDAALPDADVPPDVTPEVAGPSEGDAPDGEPDPDGTAALDDGSPLGVDDTPEEPGDLDPSRESSSDAGDRRESEGTFDISFGDGDPSFDDAGGPADDPEGSGIDGDASVGGVDDPDDDGEAEIDEWGFGDVNGDGEEG
jgi:flagellar protein FlaI